MKNVKNIVKGLVIGFYVVGTIMVSGLLGYKAYAYTNNGIGKGDTIQIEVKPAWQKVADNPESKKAMFYKVDLNNNDRILEELSYSECIYRDDKDAWYCPVDLYNEEIEHLNSKNDNNNSIVPATPYFSHVSKILKKDYV